jgi:hypothetical protein
MRLKYYPQWYLENDQQKETKYLKGFSVVSTVVFITIFILTLNKLAVYNKLLNEAKNTIKNPTIIKKDHKIIKTLENIQNKILLSSLIVKEIIINEDTALLKINIQDKKQYLDNVKYIENYYEIIDISNVVEKEMDGEKYFEVKVRVKDEKY